MKCVLRMLVGLWAALAAQAGAVTFDASGSLVYHNDVSFVPFTLAQDAGDIKIWTDSFRNGLNFDPIIALWRDGALLGENDDYPYFTAEQTRYDSGLFFALLPAGSYEISITPFSNFTSGPRMEDGFAFSAQTPRALSENGQWQLHLTDAALPPLPAVPEPAPVAMLLAGAALVFGAGVRQKAAHKHIGTALPRGNAL